MHFAKPAGSIWMPISQVEIVAEWVENIEDHSTSDGPQYVPWEWKLTNAPPSFSLPCQQQKCVEAVACFVAIYDMRWTKQNNIATNLNSLMDCETYQVLIHSYS